MRPLTTYLAFCLAALLAAPAWSAEYDCLIEPRQSINVRSQVEGVIESVLVERGDLVNKGTLVARLSSGPERADELEKQKFVSENAGDEAEAEYRLASE